MKDIKFDKKIIMSILILASVLILVGLILLLITNKKYTVTFMDEGKEYYVEQVKKNNLINRPTTPNIDGYLFVGWSLDGQIIDTDTYKVTKDITLVATYNLIPVNENSKFVVSFYTGYLEYSVEDQLVYYNNLATEPDLSRFTNITIDGWYNENNVKFDFSNPVTSDLKLYLHYTLDEKEYVGFEYDTDIDENVEEIEE